MPGEQEVRVAALQMNCGDDLDANLKRIEELASQAAARGVQLALLPENSVFMGRRDDEKLAIAEMPGAGPVQSFLADCARRHGMWLIAGSIPLYADRADKCFGASIAWDAEGKRRACYRKIHLFDVDLPDRDERYRESATMAGGDSLVTVDSPAGRLGLSICYDLRFPEMYRRLADAGATVFSVPAAFTAATGEAHWRTLLRARAIENLAYVIAAGQHGTHPNGRITYGHSMIVDPWGEVLAEQPQGDGVVDAVIDIERPTRLRRDFPVLEHRRLDTGQDIDHR